MSSFLECHVNLSFLKYSSSSLFNFARSILFAEEASLSPSDKKEISREIYDIFSDKFTFKSTSSKHNTILTFISYFINFIGREIFFTTSCLILCIILYRTYKFRHIFLRSLKELVKFILRTIWFIQGKRNDVKQQKDVKSTLNLKWGKCSLNLAKANFLISAFLLNITEFFPFCI